MMHEDMQRIVRQYLALCEEFAEYRRQSIRWTPEDLTDYDHPTHTITIERATDALERMIEAHDPEVGITWDTVREYIERFGDVK